MRHARPRSASSHIKHQAADRDGAGVREKSREPPTQGSSRPRPRSAQSRQAPGKALTPARSLHSVAAGSVHISGNDQLSVLQEQCMDMKCTVNSTSEGIIKMKTRLMALERDLQKREKLLRQLVKLSQAGQGLSMDLIDKLREERNMLPIYKKKYQDVLAQIEERDAEIRDLKRDPQFTRIIELQVEFASWQHEAKRLKSLLQEPSPEANEAARKEIEVHEQRVEKLQVQLQKMEEQQATVVGELADLEVDHKGWQQRYDEGHEELKRQQDETRDLAIAFKKMLQERKHAEHLQGEMEEIKLNKKKYEQEIEVATDALASASSLKKAPLARMAVTEDALRSSPLLTGSALEIVPRLWSLRHAAAGRIGQRSFFCCLLEKDMDADGLLSAREFAESANSIGCAMTSDEAAQFIEQLPSRAASLLPNGEQAVRWLDLLVILDRLSSVGGTPPVPVNLPDLQPLRAACIKAGWSCEDFQQRLAAVSTRVQLQTLFQDLCLKTVEVAAWVKAWEAYGTPGLLLRVPLSDVAPLPDERRAWLARCKHAVKKHYKEFVESFTVWRPDMQLKLGQFQMICTDVTGMELSKGDIDDLALLKMGTKEPEMVDGSSVLKLADQL